MLDSNNSNQKYYGEALLTLAMLPQPIAIGILILGCWNIGMQPSGKFFRNLIPIDSWKQFFKAYLVLLGHRIWDKNDLVNISLLQVVCHGPPSSPPCNILILY